MVKVPYVGLPNLLAGKEIAPELLQDKATAVNIADHVQQLLEASTGQELVLTYRELHKQLQQNSSEKAAQEIANKWLKFVDA